MIRVEGSVKKLFSEIPYLQSEHLILKRVEQEDAEALEAFVKDPLVYRYLPTFLFEQKYEDVHEVIDRLYTECFQESIILGIYLKDTKEFCGLAEYYGYRDEYHKISVGYRILRACWGQGIATEALQMMLKYLLEETDIDIVTASTMVENHASAKVLRKNGFSLVAAAADEDWGYPEPTPTDKWIL